MKPKSQKESSKPNSSKLRPKNMLGNLIKNLKK